MGLSEILAGRLVRTVFQPIVDLDDGAIVAYEALSRGPVGPLERPDLLFAAARQAGRLGELDNLCRTTALRSSVEAGIASPLAVFVNVEPEVLDSAPLDELIEIAESSARGLQVVLEITERAIAARPAELLACVRRLRAAGWRIALDDVGADDMSLAFMPMLRPDIVKLDIKLVQDRPGPAVAGIMNAVNAYAQRTGAVLLAEGIEDAKHLSIARALGARLGQGWMFGRPSTELDSIRPVGAIDLAPVELPTTQPSPFACVPDDVPLRRSTKPLLIELSKQLEREALRHGSTCVVVSTFQFARHFTPATAERYRDLADRVGFVAAIGDQLSAEPATGVRGAGVAADDPVRGEWDIVVMAPHFAAALLARDLGDTGPDRDRRFDFALTYDRDTVSAAMETLLSRVLPARKGSAGDPADAVPAFDRRRWRDAPGIATVARGPGRRASDSTVVLRRALAATTNGISIADVTRPDHPLVYVNPAFERLSGMRAEDVLGTNCRFLQGADTDPAAVARMRSAIAQGRECRATLVNYRGDTGKPWWNEIFLSPVFDDSGRLVQYIGVQNDVTERVSVQLELKAEQSRANAYLAEIEFLAFHDPLTGLLNRRRLDELLAAVLTSTAAEHGSIALLYLDIDGFKQVNDTFGHSVGDSVLTQVAACLREIARPNDLVARLGGDEFLLVLTGLQPDRARFDAGHLAARCRESVLAAMSDRSISVSIGISTFPHDGMDFDALAHAADLRMYTDKHPLSGAAV